MGRCPPFSRRLMLAPGELKLITGARLPCKEVDMQVDMKIEKWRSEIGKLVTYCIL